MRELVARMRAVMRRVPTETVSTTVAVSAGTLVVGDIELDASEHRVTLAGAELQLPLKEFELLQLLLANAGRVLPREVLIDRVWGNDYVGDTKTLDVHVKRLRSKIESDPAVPTRIVTIRGLGYKYERTKV
jgi:two-component system, OmpR family, response regulator RegX3